MVCRSLGWQEDDAPPYSDLTPLAEELTFGLVALMGLLLAASAVAIISKKIKCPFTVLLVVIGLVLGWGSRNVSVLFPLTVFTLSPEVVLLIFLPVLIFESPSTSMPEPC